MHIHLVSGIFVASEEFRAKNLQETTETLLADGLAVAGIDVTVSGHGITSSWEAADVVHLHHLANGCLRLFLPYGGAIAFTRHATKEIPWTHRQVLRRCYDRADGVVALSAAEAGVVSSVTDPGKVFVIPNGINQENFQPVRHQRPKAGGRLVLLYVGQLIGLKRVHIAIETLARVVGLGFDAELRIVSHRDTLKKELQAHALMFGMASRVHFVGAMTRAEIGNEMRQAHILVHPSRTEALPTVIAEAALTGLPVAAFDVGGIREQVGSIAKLPEVRDVEGFIRRVIDICRDFDTESNKAFVYADTMARKTSVDEMVKKHIEMYSSIVGRRRCSR